MISEPRAKTTVTIPAGSSIPRLSLRCILCDLTTDDPAEFNAHKCYERRKLA